MSATSATPETIFVLKISLQHIKPQVWRRVLVPGDYTFKDLHDVIIAVMGWSDHHMHKFNMKHPVTNKEIELGGVGDLGFGDYLWLPESTKIAHYLMNPKQKIIHEYDFGSPWCHIILFEKTLPAKIGEKYPKCIGGKNMPPPEDDPGSDYSDSEHLDKEFIHTQVNFSVCKPSIVQSPQTDKEVCKVTTPDSVHTSVYSDVDISKSGKNKSSSVGPSAKRTRVVHIETLTSSAANSEAATSVPTAIRLDASNCSAESEQRNADIQSQMGKEAEMDYEEIYGKYIASQMRLVPDLETREELRSVIQNTIDKYVSQK